jgi:hypothetical protein
MAQQCLKCFASVVVLMWVKPLSVNAGLYCAVGTTSCGNYGVNLKGDLVGYKTSYKPIYLSEICSHFSSCYLTERAQGALLLLKASAQPRCARTIDVNTYRSTFASIPIGFVYLLTLKHLMTISVAANDAQIA